MGSLHWLIVVPVYFFGALSLYALFDAVARVMRTEVTGEGIAGLAVFASMVGLIVLFVTGILSIEQLTLLPVLGLGLLSFFLAGLDALLMRALPLSSDQEHDRRRTSDPQVL